jgi:hypothetical protein
VRLAYLFSAGPANRSEVSWRATFRLCRRTRWCD